jgi:hypothetical protein
MRTDLPTMPVESAGVQAAPYPQVMSGIFSEAEASFSRCSLEPQYKVLLCRKV